MIQLVESLLYRKKFNLESREESREEELSIFALDLYELKIILS